MATTYFLDNKCDYKVNDDYSCSGVELNNAGLTIFPVIGDFCVDVEYLKKNRNLTNKFSRNRRLLV